MDYASLIPQLPLDDEGFIKSFDILVNPDNDANTDSKQSFDEKEIEQNKQEIQDFFNEYGVVVIRNILTPQELELSQTEVYDFVEENFKGFDRNNPNTWNKITGISAKLGIITDYPVMSHQICLNRVNYKLHKAYSYILDCRMNELMTNVGRVSYMRPTRNIKLTNEEDGSINIIDKPEWKTTDGKLWLHLDMDPLTNHCTTFGFMPTKERQYAKYNQYNEEKKITIIDKYDKTRIQGVLSLNNVTKNDGGFECVPGFHKIMKNVWVPTIGKEEIQRKIMSHRYQFSKDDDIINYIQKCPLRAGSLLVWNSKLPHNNFPNDSDNPRLVQYIKYARRDDTSVKFVKFGVEQPDVWGMYPITVKFPGNHDEWIRNNLDERSKLLYSIGMKDPEGEDDEDKNGEKKKGNAKNNSGSSGGLFTRCTLL